MNKLIIILVVLAIAGLVWSAVSLFNSAELTNKVSGSAEDFTRAVESEMADQCQPPAGYTLAEWQNHMSHHPEQYQACLTEKAAGSNLTYRNIKPAELNEMLKLKDFVLIDVHIPEQSHLPGTDKFIPYNQLTEQLNQLPPDKETAIVLYCRSGRMSEIAAQTLLDLGYVNVFNLQGGLEAWQAAGYLVENTSL